MNSPFFLLAFTHLTQQDWILLGVGLVCIGPLAIALGSFIWRFTVQTDRYAQIRNEVYQKRCHDCGHVTKERIPFCPSCGAYGQFPSKV